MGADLLFTLRLADPIINTSPLHPVRGQTLLHKLFVLLIRAICIIFSETVAAPTFSDLEHLNQYINLLQGYTRTLCKLSFSPQYGQNRTTQYFYMNYHAHTQISASYQVSEQFKVYRGPTPLRTPALK